MPHQVSQMLPEAFAEQHVRFYCKLSDPTVWESAKLGFDKWCRSRNCTSARTNLDPEMTPAKSGGSISAWTPEPWTPDKQRSSAVCERKSKINSSNGSRLSTSKRSLVFDEDGSIVSQNNGSIVSANGSIVSNNGSIVEEDEEDGVTPILD